MNLDYRCRSLVGLLLRRQRPGRELNIRSPAFATDHLEKGRFKNQVFETGFCYFSSLPHAQGFVPRGQNRYVYTTFIVMRKHDRYENQERSLSVKPICKRSLWAEIDDKVFSARTLAAKRWCNLFLCVNALARILCTIAETLQKGFLATCKWLPARFRKTFRNVKITAAAFQLAASVLTTRAYVTMLLTPLCLPTWTLLRLYRIALLQDNVKFCTIAVYYQHPYIWTAL